MEAAGPPARGCPEDMVRVGRSCMDRFEAGLVEVDDRGDVVPWSPDLAPPRDRRLVAVNRRGARPQAYVDADRAEAACRAAGKRLCREREWATACRGPAGSRFPYGDERRAGVCNDDGR
ncbi:MAG: SUMF1/EgtB/PvdO family nonheme iron enzyme, partial [Myxococcota bacterium]